MLASVRARRPDWPERMAKIVEARRYVPFAWGRQDCCSFAADVTVALTGRDPLAAYRGRYASEAEADRLIGPAGLEAFVTRLMEDAGATEIPVIEAQRGDWALLVIGNMPLVGVVLGAHVAAPGEDRLAFVPLRRAVRAWAI